MMMANQVLLLCKIRKLCCDNLNANYACHFTTSKYTFMILKRTKKFKHFLHLKVFTDCKYPTDHVPCRLLVFSYFQESFIQLLLWEDGNKHRLAIFIRYMLSIGKQFMRHIFVNKSSDLVISSITRRLNFYRYEIVISIYKYNKQQHSNKLGFHKS